MVGHAKAAMVTQGADVAAPLPALEGLLDRARSAAPNERISFRDLIAAYGADGIASVTPWLADRVLAAFAVRVVLKVGVEGEREQAIRVLQKSRTVVPPSVKSDVDFAIRQLQQPAWNEDRPHVLTSRAPEASSFNRGRCTSRTRTKVGRRGW